MSERSRFESIQYPAEWILSKHGPGFEILLGDAASFARTA